MNSLLALGVLVVAAILLGLVGDRLRLPRITSYLIAGVLMGSSLFGLVTGEALHHLEPIADIAMALVLFNLGAQFPVNHLLRIRKHITPLAIGDLLATFLFVTVGLLLFGQSLTISLMLGCLAMATAPATTILALRELRSEGPLTESAKALVAVNNLVCVLAFELLLLALLLFDGSQSLDFGAQAYRFIWTFPASLLIGVTIGLFLSFIAGFLSTTQWMAALLATATIVLGICQIHPASYMLTFLVMGFVFANFANDSLLDLAESERITALLSISFFAIHGADLQVSQFLQIGAVGAAYIVLRCLGKCVGIRIGSRWSQDSGSIKTWLGPTMLSQAGAAIALSAVAVSRNSEKFEPVQTIILGSVLVFEIIGPILIRKAVVQSREVPAAHLVRHASVSISNQLQLMMSKFRSSTEAAAVKHDPFDGLDVSTLVRSKVQGIPHNATLEQVISLIETSPDNTFAVIDGEDQVVGVIRYPVLSMVLNEYMQDSGLCQLVLAGDITNPVDRLLHPEDPASALYDFFLNSTDDCVPIVSSPDGVLNGIVRRSDVRAILIRSRKKGGDH